MFEPWKSLLVFVLSAALIGCGGWHLRGSGPGSAVGYKVFVKERIGSRVGSALRTELVNRGALVMGIADGSDMVLEVLDERYDRRVLSVDPATGKVREIELALSAEFQVRSGAGELLIPREMVNWQLDYVFDENSVLGTEKQDSIIEADLAAIAATAMVLRMQSVDIGERGTSTE